MADTQSQQAGADAQSPPLTTMSVLAPALGWLVPGAGHLIQKRWIRGLLLMVSVVAMFSFGLAMDGKIYKPNTGDLLDILGFVGDLGGGALYILGRVFDWGAATITTATSDYGTKYIVVAGLLNIMSVVDAYHIAIGKKQ
ncbi:MAG TPA: DUF6677 family protein [Candidatus Angelobacter sp.]